MSNDPFYEQVLAGLNGTLNPQDFEDCMADLLRELFPTLVPVRGGKDSGMDGAIADGEGEPFPLVVTTGEDVERNLRDSLDSFIERRQPARKVVFATSQVLTPPRRLKLMDLARERGFTLIQVIDQHGVANLLAKSPRWYKKLLGLSGTPSALSVVPRSRRPLLDLEPIGRAGDLEWLQQTAGDRVLSGEPGSGKTFLLYHLARQGWGLFLVDPEGDVAGALREQRPGIVIVDDAHAEPDVLVKLRHLRQQMGIDFAIVATTWEGARNEVIEAMGGIPEDKVRKLELLTRAEILEVFRSAGVEEDPDTMRYLIDQAASKPGLAVTIATLWLAGSWREVIEGKVLSRTLLAFFQEVLGPEATDVLAAFSLGGDRGLEVEAVREFLDLNRLKIRQLAAGLAAGGVLSEVERDVLAVWPRPLRSALIRTVFFPPPGQPRTRYKELFEKAPSSSKAAETLIAAKSIGAEIPAGELRQLVAGSGSRRAWNGLAQLSEQDARWVLENYPGDLVHVGGSVLLLAPEPTVRTLLEHAGSAIGPIHSNPSHPMRILSDWVRALDSPIAQIIQRRRLLARASKRYILEGGKLSVGVHGISLALTPSLESGSLDPAAGRTFTISSGLLPIDQLREIEQIWKGVRDSISAIDTSSWEHVKAMLWGWIYPSYSARVAEVPDEVEAAMHAFAAQILEDLAPLAQGSPGLAAGLRDLAKRIDFELPLGENPDFEKLYPSERFKGSQDWQAWEERQRAAVRGLAESWSEEFPAEIARKVVGYEHEAKRISRNWPRNTPGLCRDLAAMATEPELWLNAFVQEGAPADLLEPFLRAIRDRQRKNTDEILARFLQSDQYVWLAAELILQFTETPPHLLQQVLEKAASFPHLIETLCLRGQVPLENLRVLLDHPSWEVALSAAVGEWLSDPQRTVREEVAESWRNAILQAKPGEHSGMRYWLGEIFGGSKDLAFDWLRIHLQEDTMDRFFLAEEGPFSKAVSVLDESQRILLLKDLTGREVPRPLVAMLVNKNSRIYRELLQAKDLSHFHEEPLAGVPDKEWADLAIVALDSGYDTRSIAQVAFHIAGITVSWGPESMRLSQWDEAFARLEEDPRAEIREIARHGRQIAQVGMEKARTEERMEEIHGT
jgi:hypothetical protein